ncbi:MAG: GGDEF domain-containing protein [Treponema sp.]|nr:GGDEF domain-containing protein [Treponema sp.]
MILSNALNIFFGSAVIIILIFADCALKFTGSRTHKIIFCISLTLTFFALTADFISFIYFDVPVNAFLISSKIIWPFIAALYLFIYLFIVLKENSIDVLTGLGNRYSFFYFINKLARNKKSETWEIAMIDINNFKSINDIYGHLEGDNALINFSKVIKSCAGKSDFSARYGGDEFILFTKQENNINSLVQKI